MKLLNLFVLMATMFLISSVTVSAKSLKVVNFTADVPGITSLDQSFDPDSYSVITQIFDSLVHIDLDGKKQPALAVKWRLVNPTKYEFLLRKGVKFHNGEAFTAAAVKYTYDMILDPQNKAGNNWILNTIKSVEVKGPHKVHINLNHPDGMFIFRLSMFGSIAPPKYIKEVGLKKFMENPVGTGPYKFHKWVKGKQILLKKNPNYWKKGVPTLDELDFKIVPENKWVDELLSGNVDVITNVAPGDVKKLTGNSNIKLVKRRVLQGYWVMMRNRGPLAKLEVRKALNHALDKKKMIQRQGGGQGVPLASLGKIGEIGKNTKLKPYKYDAKLAKSMLAKAGLGSGFTLKAIVIEQARPLAESIKEDLAAIGVNLELEIVSRPVWAGRVIVGKITGKPYQGDLAINLVDNPIMDLAFHAGLFLASASPWSLNNDPAFDKKFVFALLRAKLNDHVNELKKLDKYIHDNAMMLFTMQPVRIFAMKKNVGIKKIGVNGHVDYYVFTDVK